MWLTRMPPTAAPPQVGAVTSLRQLWVRQERYQSGGWATLNDYIGLVETNSAYATLNLITEPLFVEAGDRLSLYI